MRHAPLALAAALILAACNGSSRGGPAAAAPDPLSIVPEVVRPASLSIPANPTTGEAAPADVRDRSVFYRYRLIPGAPVRAVLLLIPGTNAGGGDFDYMARELIRMSGGQVEVWAFERRANLLEDLTGMEAAEEAGDENVAVDYYWRGAAVDGRTFDGFLKDADVSYLSEFGLESVMRDLQAAIDLVPEANRATNVFLGGHSLGASQTLTYLGWDFDGDDATLADAGYNQVAGAILLEGAAFGGLGGASQAAYENSVAAIRSGASPRFGGFPGVTPEVTALLEVTGMAAHPRFDDPEDPDDGPEGLSQLKNVPFSDDVNLILSLIFSENLLDVLFDLPPTFRDFEVTNEALLGLVLDDSFQPISAEQASFGFVSPQTGVKRRDLLGLPGYVLTDPAPVYEWLDYDEVEGIPFTSPEEEVTRVERFAEIQWRGPSNFAEWYFALRPSADAGAVGSLSNLSSASWQSRLYNLNLFHTAKVDAPVLAIGGGSGLTPTAGVYAGTRDALAPVTREGAARESDAGFKVVIVPGVNHLDILAADNERPGGNGIFEPMLDFMLEHSQGTVVVP